jgi:MFS superfamily sulfate permease-like transporter
MVLKEKNINLKQELTSGLTSFLLITSLAVCFSATVGQALIYALVCVLSCALFSLFSKGKILAPHPLLAVPFFFVIVNTSPATAAISVSMGGCLYILLNKALNKLRIPDFVLAGGALGLCIGATILFTNSYFGIGASGATPLEMLKSYRSLGFHPHFMGLLTGTITLFTMITYPFKFKKLSKIIPAPFITVAIPYILNLFLNPDKNYTAINEAINFTAIENVSLFNFLGEHNFTYIPVAVKMSLVLCLLFFVFSKATKSENHIFFGNILSPTPVIPQSIRGYGVFSAVTVIVLSVFAMLLFPQVFSRLPVHCAGAMLIVYAWQSVPYKLLAECFKGKENRIVSIMGMIICAVSFVAADVFTATIICLLISLLAIPFNKRKELM